jgi:Rod binding domain-containing protein
MEIPAPHSLLPLAVNAGDLPLERLATNPHVAEREKIAELSRQFEAVLLRQILREAQKTVIKSDLSDDSVAGEIYRDMVTTQLAESISRSGAFGLAKSLERELSRQLLHKEGNEP